MNKKIISALAIILLTNLILINCSLVTSNSIDTLKIVSRSELAQDFALVTDIATGTSEVQAIFSSISKLKSFNKFESTVPYIPESLQTLEDEETMTPARVIAQMIELELPILHYIHIAQFVI